MENNNKDEAPIFKPKRKRYDCEKFHSSLCRWDGVSLRVTATYGICKACDNIKIERTNGINRKPSNAFGLSPKDSAKLYCMNARGSFERCTKHTNPSCGCNRLVYNKTAAKIPKTRVRTLV